MSKNGVVAVVTGATSSDGCAFAVRLAQDGADVAVLDVADARATVAEIEARRRGALAAACDLIDQGETS